MKKPWIEEKIAELEEYGNLHDEFCGVNFEDECTCDMQGMKPLFEKSLLQATEMGRVGERKRLKQQIFECNKCGTKYNMGVFAEDVDKINTLFTPPKEGGENE